MESLGSDAAPPVISAIRRVRESDVFVGIYARRYGAVDPATGKSITEVELEETERSLSAGTLTDILLYCLDADADWRSRRLYSIVSDRVPSGVHNDEAPGA